MVMENANHGISTKQYDTQMCYLCCTPLDLSTKKEIRNRTNMFENDRIKNVTFSYFSRFQKMYNML